MATRNRVVLGLAAAFLTVAHGDRTSAAADPPPCIDPFEVSVNWTMSDFRFNYTQSPSTDSFVGNVSLYLTSAFNNQSVQCNNGNAGVSNFLITLPWSSCGTSDGVTTALQTTSEGALWNVEQNWTCLNEDGLL